MKPIAYRFAYQAAHASATAVLLACLALTTPPSARGASIDLAQGSTAGTIPANFIVAQASGTQAPAETKQDTAPATAPKASPADRAEARIKELHTKLKITKDQEDLWSKVADAMRDNEKMMEPLHKARSEKAKTASAVDDLKSYSEIADAHAEGLKKFIPVFAALYDSMSDDQKKNADTVFRTHHKASKSTASKSK
jgi:hypothetical protein